MSKIYNQVGLAYAAKKIVLGTDNIIENMRHKKIKLIVLGSTASIGTQKLIQDKANTYGVDVLLVMEQKDKNISKSLGKNSIKVVGIKDAGFAKMMRK